MSKCFGAWGLLWWCGLFWRNDLSTSSHVTAGVICLTRMSVPYRVINLNYHTHTDDPSIEGQDRRYIPRYTMYHMASMRAFVHKSNRSFILKVDVTRTTASAANQTVANEEL